MKRIFAAVLATAFVVASTPGFARGGVGHGGGFRGGFVRNPTTLLGSPAPQMPAFQNRIPAPLAAPTQAPVINGPAARSPYGGVLQAEPLSVAYGRAGASAATLAPPVLPILLLVGSNLFMIFAWQDHLRVKQVPLAAVTVVGWLIVFVMAVPANRWGRP